MENDKIRFNPDCRDVTTKEGFPQIRQYLFVPKQYKSHQIYFHICTLYVQNCFNPLVYLIYCINAIQLSKSTFLKAKTNITFFKNELYFQKIFKENIFTHDKYIYIHSLLRKKGISDSLT